MAKLKVSERWSERKSGSESQQTAGVTGSWNCRHFGWKVCRNWDDWKGQNEMIRNANCPRLSLMVLARSVLELWQRRSLKSWTTTSICFAKCFFLRSRKRNSWKEKLMKTDWAISNLQMTRVFEKTRRNFQMAPQVTSPKTRCVKTPRYAFHPLSFQATKRKKSYSKGKHSAIHTFSNSLIREDHGQIDRWVSWCEGQ